MGAPAVRVPRAVGTRDVAPPARGRRARAPRRVTMVVSASGAPEDTDRTPVGIIRPNPGRPEGKGRASRDGDGQATTIGAPVQAGGARRGARTGRSPRVLPGQPVPGVVDRDVATRRVRIDRGFVAMGAAQYERWARRRRWPLRLYHVVELWSRGIAPLVVVTGGNPPPATASPRPRHRPRRTWSSAACPSGARSCSRTRAASSVRVAARRVAATARPAWRLDDRADRHRPVPRPAQPADRRGARVFSAYVSPAATSVVTGGEQW